ncbi:MAG: hypothetical protein J6128_06715 [Clostridia bacterium]|nr:hypothetical protein [Clostridia bacterium]
MLLAILFSLPVLSADVDPSSSAPQGLIIDKFEYDPDSMPWHSEDDTVRIEPVQAELPDSSEIVPALMISTGEHEPEEEVTALVSRTFDIPVSLHYYGKISLNVMMESEADRVLEAVLTISSGEHSASVTKNLKTGTWQSIELGIASQSFRDSIDYISVRLKGMPEKNGTFNFYIGAVSASGHMDEDILDRLYSAEYHKANGNAQFENSLLVFDTASDRYISASLPGFEYSAADGVLIEVAENSFDGKLRFSYITSDGSAVIGNMSKTVDLSGGKTGIILLEASNIGTAVRWTLAVESSSASGTVKFRRIMPVELGLTGFSAPGGTFSEAVLSNDGNTTVVRGTIVSEIVSGYSGSSLALYALSPGEQISQETLTFASPLSTIPISMKYEFRISNNGDRSAMTKKYLVCIIPQSQDQTPVFVGSPVFVQSSQGGSSGTDKKTKDLDGVIIGDRYDSSDAASSFTVIDLAVDELTSSGKTVFIHKHDNIYRYYNSEVVKRLDTKIRAACGDVYIRLTENDSAGSCAGILAESQDTATDIYIISNFIAERYNGRENGRVSGIILGEHANSYSGTDPDKYPVSETFSSYVDKYTDTMGIISAALYEANPEMTVFASVSDSVYGSMPFENTKDYPASCFLNALASEIKEKGDFKWSLCIDGISDPLNDYDGEFFAAARPEILSSCLKSIFSDGTVKADRIMYVWKPGSLSEPLADSYVYSVLKMFLNQDVSLFAVDLRECGDDEKDSILSIWDSHGLADISFSDPVADLIEGLPEDASRLFESIKAECLSRISGKTIEELPLNTAGTYDYFNFTELYGSGGFYPSELGTTVSSSSLYGARRLRTTSVGTDRTGTVCRFKKATDFSLTPYVSVDLELPESSHGTPVKVVFGNRSGIVEYSFVISGRKTVVCDLSELAAYAVFDYMKIIVSGLDAGTDFYTFSISGHSTELNDDDLEKSISDLQLRSEAKREDTKPVNSPAIFMGIIVIALISVFTILILSRKKQ